MSVRTRADDIFVLNNMAGIPVDPSAVVSGKGHHLIIDATTNVAPDPIGADVEIVTPPSGPHIEKLARYIQTLQEAMP